MIGAELDWEGVTYDFSRFVPRCLSAQSREAPPAITLNGLLLPVGRFSVNERLPEMIATMSSDRPMMVDGFKRLTVTATTSYDVFKCHHLAPGDDVTITVVSGWHTVLVADARLVSITFPRPGHDAVDLEFSGVRR